MCNTEGMTYKDGNGCFYYNAENNGFTPLDRDDEYAIAGRVANLYTQREVNDAGEHCNSLINMAKKRKAYKMKNG
jgi:hypothetical protein